MTADVSKARSRPTPFQLALGGVDGLLVRCKIEAGLTGTSFCRIWEVKPRVRL